MPYPFLIKKTPTEIIFDYSVDTLCESNPTRMAAVMDLSDRMSPNKFFNNIVTIKLS